MPRLIDADFVLEGLDNTNFADNGWREWKLFQDCLVGFARDVINDAPTVDPASIRHGHWVEILDSPMLPLKLSMCSECGAQYAIQQTPHFSYCPHCGTKMDEVEDGNT